MVSQMFDSTVAFEWDVSGYPPKPVDPNDILFRPVVCIVPVNPECPELVRGEVKLKDDAEGRDDISHGLEVGTRAGDGDQVVHIGDGNRVVGGVG